MTVIVQAHRSSGSIFSRGIAWFSRSPYSHISVWFKDEGVVLEAKEGKGVREVLDTVYQKARNEGKIDLFCYVAPIAREEELAMLAGMRSQLGKQYDWAGVLKFVTKFRHAHDDKWFCSEIAAYYSAEIGRPLFYLAEAWEIKPSDIPRSLALTRWVA